MAGQPVQQRMAGKLSICFRKARDGVCQQLTEQAGSCLLALNENSLSGNGGAKKDRILRCARRNMHWKGHEKGGSLGFFNRP